MARRPSHFGRAVLSILLLTVAGFNVYGQTGTGSITGKTYSSGDSTLLIGTVIRALQNGETVAETAADRNGRFRLEGLAPGRYTLRAQYVGYSHGYREVTVQEGVTAEVSL